MSKTRATPECAGRGRIARMVAAIGLAAAAFSGPSDALARNDKTRSNSSLERQMREEQRKLQAEMERQRQEMQRAQERAMRQAAEEAQREAARHSARIQAEMAAEQRREQERAQREMERAREQALREAERARQAAAREAEREAQRAAERARAAAQKASASGGRGAPSQAASGRERDDARGSGRRAAEAEDDELAADDADDVPRSADQRVREMEAQHRRALKRQEKAEQEARRKNEDRAARDRSRDRTRREAEDRSAADADPVRPGREPRLLDGVQAQAPHLGRVGRTRLDRGTDVDPRRRDDGEAADDAADASPDTPAPSRDAAAAKARPRPYAGQDKGAEMPVALYERAREAELIVTNLSPAELETAQAHGFVARGPAVTTKSGTRLLRLLGPAGDRTEAERELHKVLPFVSVGQNHAYTIFMGSLGEADGPGAEGRKPGPVSPAPCPEATCFGGSLIRWDRSLASCVKTARIGIIDTSFDTAHPSFKGLKSVQRAFLDGEAPSPYDWHGTAVLSLLAGDPASGTPGLVPDATFFLATAFRSDVNGHASTDTLRLLAALAWLDEQGVDIVNMSFSGPQDPALQRAIADMRKRGVVFIAAAGNMGPTASPSYPAAYPEVIAVTAVNRKGLSYKNANRGSYVDVSAPGVDILIALPAAKQGYRTGTSFAVPFVTAIVATYGASASAAASEAQLLQHLKIEDLGPPGRDPIYGAGLVLAPAVCTPAPVARRDAPAGDAWSTHTTTFIKAGAGLGP